VPRVVLDPGVLVSAFASPAGAPAGLVTAWLQGQFELVVSDMLLAELRRVLARDKFRRYGSLDETWEYERRLRERAIRAIDPPEPARVTPDSKDDYLVALAWQEDALLVSGDSHLLGLPGVLTPRQLLEAFQSE
jgi:putative PIN family toxin of toxin-antitoxin system